ncbi:MAG: TetR/AcrR family transcriptional regulator [Deltaproteobacteria bacterium]|nr:MAG: TetR/AcrR family transcriptional regulator [Deltaproteobacteria bacterium]
MPKRISEEQIFEATVEVVLEKGYTSATTRQIAERADMSEMTLFRRFGNKANLVMRAVSYVVEQNRVDARYTGDPFADLLHVVQHFQRRGKHRISRILPVILIEIPRHPELKDAMEAPFSNVMGVGALLMQYQAEGVLMQEHPLHAVAGLMGPLIILKMLHDAGSKHRVPEMDLEAHVRSFLKGRQAQPSEET